MVSLRDPKQPDAQRGLTAPLSVTCQTSQTCRLSLDLDGLDSPLMNNPQLGLPLLSLA